MLSSFFFSIQFNPICIVWVKLRKKYYYFSSLTKDYDYEQKKDICLIVEMNVFVPEFMCVFVSVRIVMLAYELILLNMSVLNKLCYKICTNL